MTFAEVCELALVWPGVEKASSYGTPALKVRGKLICRLKEDGETLVVRVSFDEREMLMEAEPRTFSVTDHYRPWPMMLVSLPSVEPGTLTRLLHQTWRGAASKRMLAEYERDART